MNKAGERAGGADPSRESLAMPFAELRHGLAFVHGLPRGQLLRRGHMGMCVWGEWVE